MRQGRPPSVPYPKIGDKFNSWTCISKEFRNEKTKKINFRWQCECGYEKNSSHVEIVQGRSKQCRNCGYTKARKHNQLTTESWIEKAREVHGSLYDYSEVEYKNSKDKVIITCKIHGRFQQDPGTHIYQKSGCPDCSKENRTIEDLTGRRFAKLTAIRRLGRNSHNKILWECKCDCGNLTTVIGSVLRTGRTKSCGCLNQGSLGSYIDLTERRFGKIVAKSMFRKEFYYPSGKQTQVWWKCECDCGTQKSVRSTELLAGKMKSCGCNRTPAKDEIGNKYGMLTVLKKSEKQHNKSGMTVIWDCQCECGKIVQVNASLLRTGKKKCCGCISLSGIARRKDITGNRYSRLTAIQRIGDPEANKNGNLASSIWQFKCDCGNLLEIPLNRATSGNTKSCGCLIGGEESVTAWLNDDFRRPDEESYFYVFKMKNHPSLAKPGISFDLAKRADDEYGELVDFIEGSRLDVFLIEQAVLWETKDYASIPERLEGWAGSTELREMKPDEIFEMACIFHEDLMDSGREEFTARYIPITPKQYSTLMNKKRFQ